jgi:uncharacterized protein (TIGR02996 family)
MTETLAALHAAIIEAPADRTVRLVYADALDESGDPSNAARAEFVRKHVALESTPDGDPRQAELSARCGELFAENWIDWWRPVCEAVGLPEPYVPTRRLRERVKRFVGREKREVGAPYKAHPEAWSIQSEEHGFTAQFIAGFPELLYVRSFPPEGVTRWLSLSNYFSRWTATVPLARIRFGNLLNEPSWQMLDGPHLGRVVELAFEVLMTPVAKAVAGSPNLARLETLKAFPVTPAVEAVRELVYLPTWRGLRSLALSGTTPPDVIHVLAERCTLEELESLSFGIREVAEAPNFGGLTGAIGAMFNEVLSRVFSDQALPPGPIRWPDYWPPLLALARSPVLPRLRTLQVTDAGQHWNDLDPFAQLFQGVGGSTPPTADPETLFPNALVRALAAGLDPDRLVRLELPAARLALSGRAELTRRFGPRLVLT